jgi:nitrate reductase NapD
MDPDWGKAGTSLAMPCRVAAGTALYHVAGILVYAAPEREDEVGSAIRALPGALVHAHAAGRIVATLEGPVSSELSAALDTIQRLPGVLSAVLVSEHSEPIEGIDEVVHHDR